LYSSQNVIRIGLRRMGWAGHIARIGTMIKAYTIYSENLKGRDLLGGREVDGRIILRFQRERV
jgi:hypothetical protein